MPQLQVQIGKAWGCLERPQRVENNPEHVSASP